MRSCVYSARASCACVEKRQCAVSRCKSSRKRVARVDERQKVVLGGVSEKSCPTRIENLPDAVSWERDGVSSSRDARARGNADESSAPPRLARARVRIGLCVDALSSPSDETSENEAKKKEDVGRERSRCPRMERRERVVERRAARGDTRHDR